MNSPALQLLSFEHELDVLKRHQEEMEIRLRLIEAGLTHEGQNKPL